MNVRNALKDLPEPTIYGWLDSTVALHWILGNGLYRQFVANRVQKIIIIIIIIIIITIIIITIIFIEGAQLA